MKKVTTLLALSVALVLGFQPNLSAGSWVETTAFYMITPTNTLRMMVTTTNPPAASTNYYRLDIDYAHDRTKESVRVVTSDSISGPWTVNSNWSPRLISDNNGGAHSGSWQKAWFKCDMTNYSAYFRPAIIPN